ncbi:uncharacterized protein LOC106158741 isoform X2 [Lingula anatina]|uniref:Uncharacterized protein LOC106158741 isoform X2 n=1 Tax=Lingula anatina TaxID=7574 RepID=A0A1S3HW55_LINAN|nr:uncharacterized protein LOC106158741 isoform X2 [Lingula anatina]|eukprot:XP_013390277.1 uncharacterized protein LOC106158741 isoform X2 [Lingula anatina]
MAGPHSRPRLLRLFQQSYDNPAFQNDENVAKLARLAARPSTTSIDIVNTILTQAQTTKSKDNQHPYGNDNVYDIVLGKSSSHLERMTIDSGRLCAWMTFFAMAIGVVIVLVILAEQNDKVMKYNPTPPSLSKNVTGT